jgi:hypothetical protein
LGAFSFTPEQAGYAAFIDRSYDASMTGAWPQGVARAWDRRYTIVYLVLMGWFVGRIAGFYDARTGFTALPMFGDFFQGRRLARLRGLPIYTHEKSYGYDGQFYAQLAVAGTPFDPELRTALDSAPYRSKRAFIPLLAHVIGLGRPAWVLNVYALLGAVSWLALAWALARWWFPPGDLHNLLRWAGTLFGAGMMVSATRSLTDGTALLLMAAGVRACERGRRWLALLALAAAGLVRETSLLGGAIFAPRRGEGRQGWRAGALAALLGALPAVGWSLLLRARLGSVLGQRNFDWPLRAFFREAAIIGAAIAARGFDSLMRAQTRALLAFVVQAAFVLSRRRAEAAWWRIGAAFALLATVLGAAVWEDPINALTRAILPLTLAFNVLAPRTRRGLWLLLAGNLTVLSAGAIAQPPAPQNVTLADGIGGAYPQGWFAAERLGRRTWRWASGGAATLRLHNPRERAERVTLEMTLSSVVDRSVGAAVGDLRQTVAIPAHQHVAVRFEHLVLPPGDTPLLFSTPEPPWQEAGPGGRGLTFSLEELRVVVDDDR